MSASDMGFTTGYISFEEHHSNHYNRSNTMNEPYWNENWRLVAPSQYCHREALRSAPEIHASHYRDPHLGGMSVYNDAPYSSAAYENRSNSVMKQRPVKRYCPPYKRPKAKPYYRD